PRHDRLPCPDRRDADRGSARGRWPRLDRLLKARPKAIIRDGTFDRHVLRREFMTRDEVLSQLRLHGITDPGEVHRAFIEPNGMVSVIRREQDEDERQPAPRSP